MRVLTVVALALSLMPWVRAQSETQPLRVPAFCGYAHPDARAVRRDRASGAVRESPGELRYYVEVATPGDLTIELERPADAKATKLWVAVLAHPGGELLGSGECVAAGGRVRAGAFALPRPGNYCLRVSGSAGVPLRALAALYLSGPAAEGAKTLTVERRNASSVHLAYRAPEAHRDEIAWFHCELEPVTDPLWTYYMATGWHRGYFGMQVNSDSERRLIFSVWDSGSEAVDRSKVAEDDRVQLVRKGDGVHASGFGNEGTGGHSHLVHDWRLGDRIRFLVHAEPDGTRTTYTGYYQHVRDGKPLTGEWQLLASFRAPKDGRYLHGLYSFSENFSGANGDRLRQCRYSDVWLRTQGGEWLAVREARFTHDGHGREHRLDRMGGVRGQAFFLRHGDYHTGAMAYGTELELPARDGPSGPPPQLPR